MTTWRDVARSTGGDDYAHRFAAQFDNLAAQGKDVHGEAAFVASLVPVGSSVLDAGCGTGRVASRLAELGYDVAGADIDDAMLAVAQERSPGIEWHHGGLSQMDLGRQFDVVVIAGNVIPFVSDPAESMVNVARHTRRFVVCGFGSDQAHLPPGAPVVPLSVYDEACAVAGLVLVERYSTWDRQPYEDGGYAVSVHRRA